MLYEYDKETNEVEVTEQDTMGSGFLIDVTPRPDVFVAYVWEKQ
jgi:hypothetical protein